MEKNFYYDTPIGKICIGEQNGFITTLAFGDKRYPDSEVKETELILNASRQLAEYFDGKRKTFNLPLNAIGTPFQKKVWQALLTIPYGQTVSYGYIAEYIGHSKAYRAVGGANNKNPISIFIPCHRVIGADNKLVGYGGGLDIKTRLLALEKQYK